MERLWAALLSPSPEAAAQYRIACASMAYAAADAAGQGATRLGHTSDTGYRVQGHASDTAGAGRSGTYAAVLSDTAGGLSGAAGRSEQVPSSLTNRSRVANASAKGRSGSDGRYRSPLTSAISGQLRGCSCARLLSARAAGHSIEQCIQALRADTNVYYLLLNAIDHSRFEGEIEKIGPPSHHSRSHPPLRKDRGMRMQATLADLDAARDEASRTDALLGGSRAVAAWERWMPLVTIVKWPILICVGLMLLLLLGGALHGIIDGHARALYDIIDGHATNGQGL